MAQQALQAMGYPRPVTRGNFMQQLCTGLPTMEVGGGATLMMLGVAREGGMVPVSPVPEVTRDEVL